MDPYDGPLRSPIVVSKAHSSIPYYEPDSYGQSSRISGFALLEIKAEGSVENPRCVGLFQCCLGFSGLECRV